MNRPTYRKELRKFICVVNYHRDMWPRQVHSLAPLTKIMPNKRKFKWTEIEKYSFDKIKRIVEHGTLLTYPYFIETFKINTNISTEIQTNCFL